MVTKVDNNYVEKFMQKGNIALKKVNKIFYLQKD